MNSKYNTNLCVKHWHGGILAMPAPHCHFPILPGWSVASDHPACAKVQVPHRKQGPEAAKISIDWGLETNIVGVTIFLE